MSWLFVVVVVVFLPFCSFALSLLRCKMSVRWTAWLVVSLQSKCVHKHQLIQYKSENELETIVLCVTFSMKCAFLLFFSLTNSQRFSVAYTYIYFVCTASIWLTQFSCSLHLAFHWVLLFWLVSPCSTIILCILSLCPCPSTWLSFIFANSLYLALF